MPILAAVCMLWIPFTIFATLMQAWRNAMQKQLRAHASTLAVTWARFVLGAPLAAVYLWILNNYQHGQLPHFSARFYIYILIAAITQIMATALLVMLFKRRNYAIGVGLSKSEAVLAAILGALFFAAPLNWLGWTGVVLGALAVWLLSRVKNERLSLPVFAIGLGSGFCFALCTLFIREASLLLNQGYLLNAAWVLLGVIGTQAVLLGIYLWIFEFDSLRQLFKYKKLTAMVSVFSFLGSLGWFSAMSLQTVALVKTLGQIEVVFTLMISAWFFKEKLKSQDYLGLLLISIGAVLVILA